MDVNIDDISLNNDDSSSGFGDTTSSDDDDDDGDRGRMPPAAKKKKPVLSAKQKYINRRNANKEDNVEAGDIRTASEVDGISDMDISLNLPGEERLGAETTREGEVESVKKKKNLWSKMKSRVSKTMKGAVGSASQGNKSAKKDILKKETNFDFDSII